MSKIALSTQSSYKINAVKEVLAELEHEAEILAVEVNTDVSKPPKTKDEIIAGLLIEQKQRA